MLVKEIMTKNVVTIDANDTVFVACKKYNDYKVGCLVVEDNGFCVGIVTERDIIERTICMKKDPQKTKVSEMSCLFQLGFDLCSWPPSFLPRTN